jgi:hypothetical protein
MQIKEGIVEYSCKEKQSALESTCIPSLISDWHEILFDKCLDNELTDMHVENATSKDFDNFADPSFINKNNMFVYANYLAPGIHKFVIYCPISKRAFCKTILVDTNKKETNCEHPAQFELPRKKLIMNVWRHQ